MLHMNVFSFLLMPIWIDEETIFSFLVDSLLLNNVEVSAADPPEE